MEDSIERSLERGWNAGKIFVADINSRARKFFITVPYPYVNGSLHVGHGKTYTLTDVIARYMRIQGFNVLYPMAFHQSGTPLIAYSQRIRAGEKNIIKTYRDYLSIYIDNPNQIDQLIHDFEDPKNIADFFADKISSDFRRMGYSIDWTRSFASGEDVYQDFVEWQFQKLMEKGLLVQKSYPVLYSVEDGNAVGEDDIKDGDTDKVTIDEYTGLIFHGKKFSLIAATLRPETIFGVTNLWVSPSGEYVSFSKDGMNYVVSEEGFEKISLQIRNISKTRKVSREEILEEKFRTEMVDRDLSVFESELVDPSVGTGVVFSVPGHSIWDYVGAKSLKNISPIKVIEMPGRSDITVEYLVKKYGITGTGDREKIDQATAEIYREEFYSGKMNSLNGRYSGMTVADAREEIRKYLMDRHMAIPIYETSRKAYTRSDSKVTVAVIDNQWFIDYSIRWWKDNAHRAVERMKFYPDQIKKSMHDAIEWVRERPCARRRGLGTKLPFDREWVIESLSDSTIYPLLYTVINYLREIRKITGKVSTEILDYIILGTGTGIREKFGKEVESLADSARESLKYWYPVDLRVTSTPHLSNHLLFYIMNHCAVLPEDMWPRSIMVVGLVVSAGSKIGKSKGNTVSLYNVAKQYSADVYRLAICAAADPASEMEWLEDELESFSKKYNAFCTIMERPSAGNDSHFNETGKMWFMASFRKRLEDYRRLMDNMDIRNATVSIFYEVMNDLREASKLGLGESEALSLIRRNWLVALSPIIPFASEYYWKAGGFPSNASLSSIDPVAPDEDDQKILYMKNYVDAVISDAREILSTIRIRPMEVDIIVSGNVGREIAKKVIDGKIADIPHEYRALIPQVNKMRRYIRLDVPWEHEAINMFKDYISGSIGLPVKIGVADPDIRGRNAWPGRPLINVKGE